MYAPNKSLLKWSLYYLTSPTPARWCSTWTQAKKKKPIYYNYTVNFSCQNYKHLVYRIRINYRSVWSTCKKPLEKLMWNIRQTKPERDT